MRSLKLKFIGSIVAAVLVLADIITYIVLEAVDVLIDYRKIAILFAILTPIVVVIFATIITAYLNELLLVKTMKGENKYNFGVERGFFNYAMFERKVAFKRFFKRGQQFVIAFTAADYATMRNLSRNDAVSIYSNEIATYLTHNVYLNKSKELSMNDCIYCYYHGLFLVYLWGDEAKVRRFILETEKALYEIPRDKNIKVFVQPFFGVYKLEKGSKEDLYICVDNASTARNQSERNFEGVTFYAASLRKSSSVEEVEEISQALEKGEFVVYYQPKYHLASQKFVSSEALIRWNSSKYGLLNPAKFITKAEYGGLIHELDMFVFKKVCEDLNETKRKGRRLIPVSINFSLYEFYSPNFVDDLINILEENKVPPSLVEIEVTETTSQSNPFLSISIMKKLRDRGLRILMDDFGVGYSNFNNLKKMPIDTIKIDKSFIDEIVTDSKSREIVKFLISLCKINGLEVIAEGVDNKEQVDILKKAKCDTIQGFYYSRPLSKVEYEKFLSSNSFEKKGAND